MDINFLDDDSVLIVPHSVKTSILKKIDESGNLLNVKFMSREEFIEKSTFSYDDNALLYLMDEYDYDYGVAKTLMDNMRLVEKREYPSSKLKRLVSLKEELLQKDLITIDSFFPRYLQNKNVYIYGYQHLDNLFLKSLESYRYQFITEPKNDVSQKIVVHRANSLEEEVDFVFNRIGDLIHNGVDINDIFIVNFSSKYENTFAKLSKFYNLPIEDLGYSIYSSEIVKEYLKILRDNQSIEQAYDFIKSKYDSFENSKLLNIILNVSNRFNDLNYSFDKVFILIEDALKNSFLKVHNYENKISFGEMNPVLYDDTKYVFLIGFNQNELPHLYGDEDYLTDAEKKLLGMETASLKNQLEREKVTDFIERVPHLTLSYPLHHLSEEYHLSNLAIDNNYEIVDVNLSENNYSKDYARLKLTKYLDDFVKYGTIEKDLFKYYNNYEINYLTYNNSFKGLSKERLLKKINNELILSYSAINNYNKCHFRYYVENILRLNKYEETFPIKVGNLFHYLLSLCFDDDFDLDKEWDNYLSQMNLSDKEQVFLVKLKEEFLLILDFVKNLHHETSLTNTLMEHKVYVDKSRDIDVKFMGIIDKCMYREKNGETLVSIIDYKTGNPDNNLYQVAYGLNMQLPIYWYLIKKGSVFANSKFVGFYIQKILHSELKKEESKNYHEAKLNNLKLIGYSTDDRTRLMAFDPTYEKSSFIKSMSVKQDGEFGSRAKIIDDQTLDLLVEYIDKIIENDINNILTCDFSINPKQIGDDDEITSCVYCHYKDLCYRRNEDVSKKSEYHNFSFLGGDSDARLD